MSPRLLAAYAAMYAADAQATTHRGTDMSSAAYAAMYGGR